MRKMRSGFTTAELIVVLLVISGMMVVLLQGIPALLGWYKSTQISATVNNAQTAYSQAYGQISYSIPVSVGDKMNCMTFKGGDQFGAQDANLGTADEVLADPNTGLTDEGAKYYYKEFDRIFRTNMIQQMGFRSSSNDGADAAGLYLPGNPRNKIYLCARGAARFLVVTQLEGKLAANVLSRLNNGLNPSSVDGAKSDRRAAIWTQSLDTFKSSAYSQDWLTAAIAKKESEIVAETTAGNGSSEPYTDLKKIQNMPSVTISYLLNPAALTASW